MNTRIATLLALGALLVPAAGYAAEKSMTANVKEAVVDSVITTKIKAAFAKDKQVSAKNISVDTDDKGVVTLSGNARNKAEAAQAVRIAHNTKGVTSVKNDIQIAAAPPAPVAGYTGQKSMTEKVKESVADSVITTKIKAEYAKDKQVSAMDIKVDTDDKGAVTLSGNAKSKSEADQAVKLARDTKGVTSVRNDIMVQPK